MEDQKKKVIEIARTRRLREELSIRKLAEITGVSYATLSRLERGQGSPDDNTIVRLAHWLGTELDAVNMPITNIAEVHFRAAKNVDAKTIEALSSVASLVRAQHTEDF
jgi:transcriptional regulator with XRE-family HTH domain